VAKIRRLEIENFRAIKRLVWCPSSGFNCLIGPGDSGKTTILEAIDLCLGSRRNPLIDDADFHDLDTTEAIRIEATLGDLDDDLKNLATYGLFLRGFDPEAGTVEDEPGSGLETAITVRLSIGDDLEPRWTLVSKRAEDQGQSRGLSWADRVRLSPAKIGVGADYHLSWSRGSVLARIADEKPEVRAALAAAGRGARDSFGESADKQLGSTLAIVVQVATELGIDAGKAVKALLDIHAISFSAGVIALHDDRGVPLRRLGVGSARLLVAGLQRRAADATVVLVDELEYGLEPHRVRRLVQSLGSKNNESSLQVFATTHSPTALEELDADQLFVVRGGTEEHLVLSAGGRDEVQAALRSSPGAFLSECVIACEGASEVGLIRGLDLYRASTGHHSVGSDAAEIVDLKGSDPKVMISAAQTFQSLGYRTAFIRDSDKPHDQTGETAFVAAGGHLLCCEPGRALEDEIFDSLAADDVGRLVDIAVDHLGSDLVDQQIRSAGGGRDLASVRAQCEAGTLQPETRSVLGSIAKSKGSPWFKSVGRMERAGREVVGPGLAAADETFRKKFDDLFAWVSAIQDD
jgi:putative ATP-dependent endonuclease of the OLD family